MKRFFQNSNQKQVDITEDDIEKINQKRIELSTDLEAAEQERRDVIGERMDGAEKYLLIQQIEMRISSLNYQLESVDSFLNNRNPAANNQ